MKTFTPLTGLLFSVLMIFAQANDKPDREAFKLSIAVDNDNFYSEDIKSSPYVLPDNSIQLYPGENIFVEVEFENDNIKSMKTVKENLHPEKTLVISFGQEAKERKHEFMTLNIKNPFDKMLEYKAGIYLTLHNKWISTNVLPVKPGLSSFETWPDVITTIVLRNWTFKKQ